VAAVREKVLAAHRAAIKRVIMPDENENDLTEISEDVRRELEFVLVDNVDAVLNAALHPERRTEGGGVGGGTPLQRPSSFTPYFLAISSRASNPFSMVGMSSML